MRIETTRKSPLSFLIFLSLSLVCLPLSTFAGEEEEEGPPSVVAAAGTVLDVTSIAPEATAVVNFNALVHLEAMGMPPVVHPLRPWMPNEFPNPAEPKFPPAPEELESAPPIEPFVASPSPTTSFQGLDDIAMADSLYIVIPPDVGGGVGPSKVMCSFNNNYRIFNKSTGAVLATLGTATFWASVVAVSERLALTDPKTMYDPYNNRWIVEMQTVTAGAGKILVGVSQTSDPQGAWNLYSFNSGMTIDFPNVGFNKNWICVAINGYTGSTFSRGLALVVNYPQARAGVGSGTLFTQAAGSHFCSAPCVTYSATEDTLFVVTHLSSGGATYQEDKITGTSAAPVYTSGVTQTRTGGGWTQPSGNILPQSAPILGVSACGATPCKIETQDSQVRSSPVYRGNRIWYAQTIGLPSVSMTRTAAQWTKINAASGVFVDGGRIDDPTATATNGGKWYAYAHLAVNANLDFVVGYTQFSSAQHPSSGYSVHYNSDGAGTIRDPLIFHTGEDYYHKTFSTTTGRNRWGDFSTAQVDPSDDQTLWTLQEYARARAGTDDGNTGSNSSKWSSWWAGVSTQVTFTINASAGANGAISPSGAVIVNQGANQGFTITPSACYHVADLLVDGVSVGAVTSYTFTNVQANHTIAASFAIDTYTITASAGANGLISPSGGVVVNCGANQLFAITPNACYHVSDVLVDGVSVGPVTTYTFNNVHLNHTILASFAITSYTINASAGAGGTISPSGAVVVNCGASQAFTISAAACSSILDVVVDGSSVGAVSSYTFTNVQANHTIQASFSPIMYTITASAGPGGSITPSGPVSVPCAGGQNFSIAPNPCFTIQDVLVDGSSVGPVSNYAFSNVQASHTISASFAAVPPYTITATAGAGGSITPSGGVPVACGANQGFTITPDPGFIIVDVLVDGSSVGAVGNYTFTSVGANHTIAASFSDAEPPSCVVLIPNGGDSLQIGDSEKLTWTATDNDSVSCVTLLLSRTGIGGPYADTLGVCVPNTGSFVWSVTGPVSDHAVFKILATDTATLSCDDESDAEFIITLPVSGVDGATGTPGFALSAVGSGGSRGPVLLNLSVPQAADVRVAVYDIMGREIALLADRSYPAGHHQLQWNTQGPNGHAPAGLYFFQARTAGRSVTQKFILAR